MHVSIVSYNDFKKMQYFSIILYHLIYKLLKNILLSAYNTYIFIIRCLIQKELKYYHTSLKKLKKLV